MTKPSSYDLVVIGAGSGGVRAARIAASLGARVAIIENRYFGGTCVNVGCVPKKLFMYAATYSSYFEEARGFGWQVTGDAILDWGRLRDNKTNEINRLESIYKTLLEKHNVDIFEGEGRITGPNEVTVGDATVEGTKLSAKHILVATGGWPVKPTYSGNEHVVDSNAFFYLESLPKQVIIEGGGYIAVEFASILAGLGVEVELIYRGELFLRGFDDEIRTFLADELRKKGLTLNFNTQIKAIKKVSDQDYDVTVEERETGQRVIKTGQVITAIGRRPMTDGLGLEALGIKTSDRGFIEINDHFQTTVPSIYAVGDVVGRMALTPVALREGETLARHLFEQKPIAIDYNIIATAVFTNPNIGTVGLSEQQALASGFEVECYRSRFTPLKHTLSKLDERTFMKLVCEKGSGRILGCHMVGESAGEIMQGLAIALKMGATKEDFDRTIGIHPTSAEEFVTMR